jgi:hypothetical protein
VIGGLVSDLIGGILSWFVGMVAGVLNVLWDLLAATIFQTPDVTLLPQVQTVAHTSLVTVNVAYILAFLYMAIMVMGRDTIQSRYGPGELIPRLIIGLIASNFALPLCSTVIGLANGFTSALTSQGIDQAGSLQQLRTITTSALTNVSAEAPIGFLLVVIGVLIAVMVGMLAMQWIIRLGLLVVLVGISPVALALHATPATEGAAKLWWRSLGGAVGTVVIQAVALHTTLVVFLSPGANLPALGIPGDPGTVMNLLIVVGLLFGVLKVPGLMRRYVTQSRPGVSGQIFRLVIIQQITRGLSKAFGAGRSARVASTRAPRPTPAPGGGWPTHP